MPTPIAAADDSIVTARPDPIRAAASPVGEVAEVAPAAAPAEPAEAGEVPPEYRYLYDPANTVSSVPSDYRDGVYVGPEERPAATHEVAEAPADATAGDAAAAGEVSATGRTLAEAQRSAAEAMNALADQVREVAGQMAEAGVAGPRGEPAAAAPAVTPADPAPVEVVAEQRAEADVLPVDPGEAGRGEYPEPESPVASSLGEAAATGGGDGGDGSATGGGPAAAGAEAAEVVATAASAFAASLTEAAAVLTASVAATEEAMALGAGSMAGIAPAIDAVVASASLLAAAEDAAVAALSPVAQAATAMQVATGALTAQLQGSIAGIQSMAQAQAAATQALQALAQAAQQAAANTTGGGPPGGPGGPAGPGGGSGWGTFGSFDPATGQTAPIAFNPATREFFNTESGMGMAGVDWPGFANAGGGGGGNGGGGNGGGGGGTRGRRGGGHGIGRMLGAFYLANEAHRVLDTESEYENASDLAGSNQQEQFKASDHEIKSLEGGIFGLVAGEIVDPGGHRLAADEDTVKAAEASERADDDVRSGVKHVREVRVAAEEAAATTNPQERKAEQDARDLARQAALDQENKVLGDKQAHAAAARDAATAAANQDRRWTRAKAAILGGVTFGLAAPVSESMDTTADVRADAAISDAEATYRARTTIAGKQEADAKAAIGVKADAEDRKAKQKDATADAVFADQQGAEVAALTDDRVTERVDRKKASVAAEAQRIRDTRHDDAAAQKYLDEVGNPSVERERTEAYADEDARRHEASRQAGDLEGDARGIAERRAGQTDRAAIDAVRRAGDDRVGAASDRLDRAKASHNQSDIDDASRVLAATKADANARVEEKTEELARAATRENSESADRVADEQVSAEEAALRAKGQLYEADTLAFKQAQDDKLKHLREKLAEETDARKKANIQAEIDATEKADPIVAAARDAEHARADTDQRLDSAARVEEMKDEDSGQAYAAQLARLKRQHEHQAEEDAKSAASAATVQAHADEYQEQLDSAQHHDERKYDNMRVQAEETLLRADGRGGEADLLAIRQQVAEQERAIAPNDPERDQKLADVKALGLARVAAVEESYKPKVEFGLSNQQYYQELQEHAVQGKHTQDALRAAADLKADIGKSDAAHPVQGGDVHTILAGLGDASKDIKAAAKYLMDNTVKLYVAGGNGS